MVTSIFDNSMHRFTRSLRLFALGSFSLCLLAHGQSLQPKMPCTFNGKLLRDSEGRIVRYESDEMTRRAIAKVDLKGFIKQVDIRTEIIVDVLVGDSGEVVCTKSLVGLQIARKPTEEALQSWRFKTATEEGKPVAYLGRLEFTLCNTSCGDEGPSMTLLK